MSKRKARARTHKYKTSMNQIERPAAAFDFPKWDESNDFSHFQYGQLHWISIEWHANFSFRWKAIKKKIVLLHSNLLRATYGKSASFLFLFTHFVIQNWPHFYSKLELLSSICIKWMWQTNGTHRQGDMRKVGRCWISFIESLNLFQSNVEVVWVNVKQRLNRIHAIILLFLSFFVWVYLFTWWCRKIQYLRNDNK